MCWIFVSSALLLLTPKVEVFACYVAWSNLELVLFGRKRGMFAINENHE